MAYSIVHSRSVYGTTPLDVRVETHVAGGLPRFTIVGLPETTVRESRDRVHSALQNAGFEFPAGRVTVNLAPGDVPKDGTRFDLAIAIGILAATRQVPPAALAELEFVAELALDGSLRPARATLVAALGAAAAGRALIVSPDDAPTAALVDTARVMAAPDLQAVARHLEGIEPLSVVMPPDLAPAPTGLPDLAEVRGQARARRALEIAASGGHNVLLIGPPGTGKSMLAQRLPGLLPPLETAAALDSAALHALAGLAVDPAHWGRRPFRAPHHACSAAALVGGGRIPRPGEISLAHHGVLFLDELPEFDRRALEALREPLELGRITVARASHSVTFPARFQLVAAMNPCPCGYAGDPRIECRCSPERTARYRARVSGPLAERIDIHLDMPRERLDVLTAASRHASEPSAVVAARVAACQALQRDRQGVLNARLEHGTERRHCPLTAAAQALLLQASERLALSARSYHKVLKLARTIADLEGQDTLTPEHVAEAITYRGLDRRA